MKIKKIPIHNVERISWPCNSVVRKIPALKYNNYVVENRITVDGDAPKVLLHVYEYKQGGKFRKNNPNGWPLYIAKTGHKWYPVESITEYLLNILGGCFGLRMAESKLVVVGGQVRFLSKYFLKKGEEQLVHGAEIFAGYIGDEKMVEDIEEQGMSRDFFSLQFVESAVKYVFPNDYREIMHELIKLLLFDALVGNNDRHYFNWGVVKSFKPNSKPRFSPIYDTARGLFWNGDEEKIDMRIKSKNFTQYVEKYCENSRPKLGWDNVKNINHFKLVDYIYRNEFYISKDEMKSLFSDSMVEKMKTVVNLNFRKYFTDIRRDAITMCLDYRYNKIKEKLNDGN